MKTIRDMKLELDALMNDLEMEFNVNSSLDEKKAKEILEQIIGKSHTMILIIEE